MKFTRPRKRIILVWGGALAVLTLLWLTDPDGGASTRMWALGVASTTLVVTLAYWARKGLFDYPEADMGELAKKAAESSIGAAITFAAICAVFIALLFVFAGAARAQDVRTHVPAAAVQLLPTLRAEQRAHWLDHPAPELLAALVEHESCISLKHSRCWNPASRLKSAREEGAGLGQITRTWRKDGTPRFDSLQELVDKHPALAGWSWNNVYQRADLQLRAVVLMSRDNYRSLARVVREPPAVLAFADAAYNGGLAGVQNERRACAQVPGCDPQRWFGHVAKHCLKSRAALYGQRSACDINRHHVTDVLLVRAAKYQALGGWF